MTSNARPDTCLRALRRLLASLLLAALAACGPGSGGTGTGPVNLFFGGTTATGLPGTVGGSVGPLQLRLQDASVELTSACGRFVFAGDWSGTAGSVLVLPGRIDTGAQSAPATLRLQFSAAPSDSAQVTVTLFDAAGAVLLGPVLLDRRVGPEPDPATGACG
jgi:hypothetical protein